MSDATPKWQELLTLARSHLEGIGATRANWTWGGGTVLMLRHQHRLSWDIDLFLDDPQYLSYLSPRLNDNIAETVDHYTEQANHLRCFVTDVGEIDYLLAAPVIDLTPERMDVEGHGPLQVMSDREILGQKLYYRSTNFTGRDLYDFATITTLRPELLRDEKLKEVGDIRKKALESRLDAADLRDAFEGVTVHAQARVRPTFERARATLQTWLGLEPTAPAPRPPSAGPSM